MRPFTDEEFEIMISEMTDEKNPSFHMLCAIADKTLRSKVKFWCATDSVLRGRGMEDDIMQDIFIRLIQMTVTHFLIREDSNGEVNRNPEEFKSWIYKVAERIKIDAANALRNKDYKARGFADGEEEQIPNESDDEDERSFQQDTLAEAFKIILESDARIYKILTWLAQSLFIIGFDVTKIQSNDAIITAFSEKTLFQMKDILLGFADKIDWIVIAPKQIEQIDRALNAEFNNKRIGEIKYKDFFMKKGGKASISDWVNRMNRLIESRMKIRCI